MWPLATSDLILFIAATFAASLVAGIAGFAFGLIAASMWLHILSPLQTATLIVVFGLIVQGYAVWNLRHALRMERLWPFLIGGVVGVPIGVELLRAANPAHVRWTVGVLLIAFVFWSIVRPTAVIARGGRLADGGVAVASGVVGGLTGLGGILATVWCSLRGWPKDQQRAVFQPVAVVIFLATIAWLGGSGAITREIVGLILAGLPAVLIGVWAGMKLYGRLSETGFRAVVLALLFISGAALLLR